MAERIEPAGATATTLDARLAALGYYYGETYYHDPNKATTCWLRSDGAGSSWPVSEAEQALLTVVAAAQTWRDCYEREGTCGPLGGIDTGDGFEADDWCDLSAGHTGQHLNAEDRDAFLCDALVAAGSADPVSDRA